MLAILENPEVRARVPAISVEQYHRLYGTEAKVELFRGVLVEEEPKCPLHSTLVGWLHDHLEHDLPDALMVRQEHPLTLKDSEPDPDLAVVAGSHHDFFTTHPSTALVIVEIAVTTEAYDRLKLEIYAEAGVAECWLVLPEKLTVERHTEPVGASYGRVERAVYPQTLESTVLPGLQMPPDGLFRL